jgi:hypothetical protein
MKEPLKRDDESGGQKTLRRAAEAEKILVQIFFDFISPSVASIKSVGFSTNRIRLNIERQRSETGDRTGVQTVSSPR